MSRVGISNQTHQFQTAICEMPSPPPARACLHWATGHGLRRCGAFVPPRPPPFFSKQFPGGAEPRRPGVLAGGAGFACSPPSGQPQPHAGKPGQSRARLPGSHKHPITRRLTPVSTDFSCGEGPAWLPPCSVPATAGQLVQTPQWGLRRFVWGCVCSYVPRWWAGRFNWQFGPGSAVVVS